MSDGGKAPAWWVQALRDFSMAFAKVGAWTLSAGFLGGLGAFGVQCVLWLRYGAWPKWPIGAFLEARHISEPRTSWLGIQKVIDLLWQIPVCFTVFGMGLAASLICLVVVRVLEEEVWRLSRSEAGASVAASTTLRPGR
jgi:hypothetical protein